MDLVSFKKLFIAIFTVKDTDDVADGSTFRVKIPCVQSLITSSNTS